MVKPTVDRNPVMQYFDYSHLPPHLASVSMQVHVLAFRMDEELPQGPEKSAGLRKLLEAKDCFVRAALQKPLTEDVPTPL